MTEYEANKILDDYLKLQDVFQFYGIEIKYNGFCCCPFHNEKTASCKVNDRVYHCFGCGAKGNALTLVEQLFNLDFKTAIQKLNYDFGLNLLDQELTKEQRAKIKQRRIVEFKKKEEDEQLEELKQEYETAWKHYLFYKPEERPYNIDTPQYLIDEWFNSVDKRYWKAIETLERLKDVAIEKGFYMEECDARWAFLEPKTKIKQDDQKLWEFIKWTIDWFKELEKNRRDN